MKRKRGEWKIDIDFKFVFDGLLIFLTGACRITFFTSVILVLADVIRNALMSHPVWSVIAILILCSFAISELLEVGNNE